MINRQWGNTKDRQTLEYSVVYLIARKTLVDRMEVRAVAKELRLKPKLVAAIVNAKSHKEHWINAIVELSKAGFLKD